MEINTAKAAQRCVIAAVGTSLALTYLLWGFWWYVLFSWVLCFPFALFYSLLYGIAASLMGAKLIENKPELEDNVDENVINLVEFETNDDTILSGEVIGRFADADIHAYVLVDDPADPTNKIKCEYERCVDLKKDFTLPSDAEYFVVIEPGILYVKRHEPENA